MKPAPFDYYAPDTLSDVVALLQRLENDDIDAKVLAGGQSLLPMLSLRVARPEALVDLRKLTDLNYIREEGDALAIGAMTTKSAVEDSPLVQRRQPLLHAATRLVGHRQIRNRGSFGGSFTQADPASEYPAAAIALDMELKVVGPDGERRVAAQDFFITYMTTDLDTTEVLTEIRVPALPAGTGWSFQEIARRHGDFAMAGVAVTLRVENGVCRAPRIVAFGVGATALRLPEAEQVVDGKALDSALFQEAGHAGAAALEEPSSDVHASADYRRQLVAVLVARGLAEAVARSAA